VLLIQITAEQFRQFRDIGCDLARLRLVPLLIGRPWSLPLRRLVLLLKHGRRIPTRLCTVEIVSRHDPQPCGKPRIRAGQG
jgi:hypothetical protein